jgi:hypothetical protein
MARACQQVGHSNPDSSCQLSRICAVVVMRPLQDEAPSRHSLHIRKQHTGCQGSGKLRIPTHWHGSTHICRSVSSSG